MSQSDAQTEPMLSSTNDTSNNKPTKIVLVATLISLIILIIVNLPNLHSGAKFWGSNDSSVIGSSESRNGHRSHRSSAVLMKNLKQIETVASIIPKADKKNKFLEKFTLNGPQITYNGPSQKWTQLLAYKPIPYNETYKIKMLIVYSNNRHIMFGITNQERIVTQSSFFNEDTYAYYGHNGCLWAEGQLMLKDEAGFVEKDIVEIDVQLWEGIVQWKVNGSVKGQIFSQNLRNQDRKYVPYLQMFQKNDQIRMIE